MLSSKEVLHIIAAIVIYQEKGLIEAMQYLRDAGYSDAEAIDLLTLVDNTRDAVRNGALG